MKPMRVPRLSLVPVLAGLACSLAWIVSLQGDVRAARARLAAARQQQAHLALELAEATRTSEDRAAPTQPVAPAPAASRAAPAGRSKGLIEIARTNPQFLNLFVADKRSEVEQRYGVLFQDLHLTVAERERFKDIVAAETARNADIATAGKETGLSREDPIMKTLARDSRSQTQAELRGLLGDAGFAEYERFTASIPLRGFVDGFAVQVAETEPLTPSEARQLTEALVASAPPPAADQVNVDPAAAEWTAVDRAAKGILSPSQFEAWKLGVAHNPYGGSRLDQEFLSIYRAAKAKDAAGSAATKTGS